MGVRPGSRKQPEKALQGTGNTSKDWGCALTRPQTPNSTREWWVRWQELLEQGQRVTKAYAPVFN